MSLKTKISLCFLLYATTLVNLYGQSSSSDEVVNSQKQLPYILKTSGDTLRGKIVLKYRDKIVQSVLFESNGILLKFSPKDIKEAFNEGSLFRSRIVTLNNFYEGPLVQDTVFVEVLARADVDLLYYEDKRDQDHFFLENHNQLEELVVKTMQNNGFGAKRLDLYKGQLKTKFKQCPSLFSEIDNLPYERTKMLNLFIKGSNCTGQPLTLTSEVKTRKTKVRWGVIAGITIFSVGGIIWATKNHYDPFLSQN